MAELVFPKLHFQSKKFDLDDAPKAHSDGKVIHACQANGDFFADDDTLVRSQDNDSTYTLSLPFRSESNVPLWNDGIVRFFFDKASSHWSMDAVVGASLWKFCNPDQVFEIALAGFECAAGDNNVDVAELIKSIRAQKAQIVAKSSHYATEDDCKLPEPIVEPADYSRWNGYGTQGWE